MSDRQKIEKDTYDKQIKPNIFKIYAEYKKTEEPVFLRHRQILNDQQFETLEKYLVGHFDSVVWADCMFGCNEDTSYPKELRGNGIMLTGPQAIKLVNMYMKLGQIKMDKDPPEKVFSKFELKFNPYKFSHAIGMHVLLMRDVNQLNKDFILRRYYIHCNTIEEIKELWSSTDFVWSSGSKCIVGECPICLEDVSVLKLSEFCICDHCKKITHFRCKMQHLLTTKKNHLDPTCENCNYVYKKVKDLHWDSMKCTQISPVEMIPTTWLDVYVQLWPPEKNTYDQ